MFFRLTDALYGDYDSLRDQQTQSNNELMQIRRRHSNHSSETKRLHVDNTTKEIGTQMVFEEANFMKEQITELHARITELKELCEIGGKTAKLDIEKMNKFSDELQHKNNDFKSQIECYKREVKEKCAKVRSIGLIENINKKLYPSVSDLRFKRLNMFSKFQTDIYASSDVEDDEGFKNIVSDDEDFEREKSMSSVNALKQQQDSIPSTDEIRRILTEITEHNKPYIKCNNVQDNVSKTNEKKVCDLEKQELNKGMSTLIVKNTILAQSSDTDKCKDISLKQHSSRASLVRSESTTHKRDHPNNDNDMLKIEAKTNNKLGDKSSCTLYAQRNKWKTNVMCNDRVATCNGKTNLDKNKFPPIKSASPTKSASALTNNGRKGISNCATLPKIDLQLTGKPRTPIAAEKCSAARQPVTCLPHIDCKSTSNNFVPAPPEEERKGGFRRRVQTKQNKTVLHFK